MDCRMRAEPTAAETIAGADATAIVEVRAPAKINLDLLITGRRADGFHELDSCVVFTEFGDRVRLHHATELSLTIDGPMAAGLDAGQDNLVWRAAKLLADRLCRSPDVAIHLDKHLPMAAGLGGGSSDAAATLRGLVQLWQVEIDDQALRDLGQELGADLPVCIYARSARMRGIGERLDPMRGLPELPLLLANARCAVATREVFARLDFEPAPSFRAALPAFPSIVQFTHWLSRYPNELETAAMRIESRIEDTLEVLRALPDCLLARMSGSGATCFGIFEDEAALRRAETELRQLRPDWWIVATQTVSG